MPKINLRLTEEEHERLKEWAYDSHRSIQKEAVWRLFGTRIIETEHPEDILPKLIPPPASSVRVTPDGGITPEPRAHQADDHFKPDFKK